MRQYISEIKDLWHKRDLFSKNPKLRNQAQQIVEIVINELDEGNARICEKKNDKWHVNEWAKKAILLYFQLTAKHILGNGSPQYFDKVPLKCDYYWDEEKFEKAGFRAVPGCIIRKGAHIAKNVVVMPSFVNIGAYVGENSMIDSWVTVGSCAQVGKNCHISEGVGLGGVLEPLQAKPVIIEDNCFIGAKSEIVEGVKVETGAVISMGVYIGASTKIYDRETGEVITGRVPAYSVVVPGTMPAKSLDQPGIYCAVIVKKVDAQTLKKTSINEILRTRSEF